MFVKNENHPNVAESFKLPDGLPKEGVGIEFENPLGTGDKSGLPGDSKFFFEASLKHTNGRELKSSHCHGGLLQMDGSAK